MISTTPTAFALSISDILLLILDHLPAADLEAACALARLARTSRTWSDPALAALWHVLPSPAPLRALMPPPDDAGQPEVSIPGLSYLVAANQGPTQAWRVFDDHAILVRTWGPDTRFLAHVFHRRPPSPAIFSALRTVGLQSDSPIPPSTLLPHLRTAHLYFSYWSLAPPPRLAWDPLRFLASAAPALTTLSIAGRVPLSALRQLRDLRALDRLDLARAELPTGIGALHVLAGVGVRRLMLPRRGFPEAEYAPAPSSTEDRGAKAATSASPGFARVEHLHLPSTTPDAASAFLAFLASSSALPETLRSVSICTPTALHSPLSHSDSDWSAVLAGLPRRLHTLRLHTTDGTGVPLHAFAQLGALRVLDADVSVYSRHLGLPNDGGSGLAMKRVRLRLHHPPRSNASTNTNISSSPVDDAGEPDTASLAQMLDVMWPALEQLTVIRDSGPGPYFDMRRDGWEAEGYGEEYSYGRGGGRGEGGGDGKEEVLAGVWEAVRELRVARACV